MTAMTALRAAIGKPWTWSFMGALLVWLAAIAFTGGYFGFAMHGNTSRISSSHK